MRWIQAMAKSMMGTKQHYRRETIVDNAPKPGAARGRNPEVEAEYQAAMARMAETDREYVEEASATLDRVRAWADERYEAAVQEQYDRRIETDRIREEALAAQQERFAEIDAMRRGDIKVDMDELRELYPDVFDDHR